ncbi:hypothetical protein HUA74_07235 [Myxococcus sp. CA051A]|uniref:hypothetical protein n=1 Tax=Myxococcus sp. CA051A TaxID=2741739 RepID=UPI00157B5E32|nr:hypothetical protein [Myxococcus sp. CA051A]NTX60451.1 hypothetical protein [Myxococcus sp. CA051A]
MPFFIPLAVGGLVLTALGLGVKRVLDEGLVGAPEPPEVRAARERHAVALGSLKSTRLRVRAGMASLGERQVKAKAEVVEPLRGLLARLERWEHARREDVLPAEALAALEALPAEPVSRAARRAWPLFGSGATAPPELVPVLEWLERGWLQEDAVPVVLDGMSLFHAAAPWAASPAPDTVEARVRCLEDCAATLTRATDFLEALLQRLAALDARVGALQGRAEVQLTYLDAASFEEGGEEPRERLSRLGVLAGRLMVLLRAPVLTLDGHLAPEPPVSVEEATLAPT